MMLFEINFNWNSPIGLRTYSENDTVQTAYDKLEQTLNEAASNFLPKKQKNTNKSWVATQSLDLIEQR